MEKLNEKIDYSTQGIVKAINSIITRMDEINELTLKMQTRHENALDGGE